MEKYVYSFSYKDYPESLKNIYDPPKQLYIYSKLDGHQIDKLMNKAVAVVGTRHPSRDKVLVTRELVARLVREKYTIISGMAVGVDSVAHQTALENGGNTIAVLGAGIDIIYPPENKVLYFKIASSGAIISEHSSGKIVPKNMFAARNRIITGLSQAVFIIECELKSGTMITAKLALEQGKEVFCVPGSPGCDYLISQGAGIL